MNNLHDEGSPDTVNWYKNNSLIINGIKFDKQILKPYVLPDIVSSLSFTPESFTRYQLNKLHTAKTTELNLLINSIHLSEFYGLSFRDIEDLVESQTGYYPGWIEHLNKILPSLTTTMPLEAMATISHTLDKLAGIETQANFTLLCRSNLYYNYGLLFSFCDMLYFVPPQNKIRLYRVNSSIQAAEISLNARKKFMAAPSCSKPSKIHFKKWYLQ